MIEVIDMFKHSVTRIKLQENLKEIYNFCISESKRQNSQIKSNSGGYHSNNLNIEEPVLKSLVNSIELNANLVSKELFKINIKLKIDSMWFIINKYKDFNLPHTHTFSKISGVFYVNVPKNSGDLVFLNDTKIENYLNEQDIYEYNLNNSSSYFITPEINTLYLFPSWLNHYVKPNLSKEKRVSISFNLNF
jgi:uncharacterized protein (TIGR02466 family)